MNANIRRLIFDLTGPMSLFAVFMFASIAFDDMLWLMTLRSAGLFASVLPGLLAVVTTSLLSARKAAIWCTLPVSRRDIDIARWWQMIAAPQIILLILLMASAIGMDHFAQPHKPWMDIQFAAAAQCLVCAGIAGIFLLQTLAMRMWRRLSVVLMLPIFFLFSSTGFLASQPTAITVSGSVIVVMIVCTFAIDAALYLWAGSWPLPLTSPPWERPGTQKPAASAPLAWLGPANGRAAWQQLRSGSIGSWPLFGWNQFSGLAVMMGLQSLFLLLLQRWVPVQFFIVTTWIAAAGGAMIPIANFATAIRALRGLPMGTWQLTGRVMTLLLAIQGLLLAAAEAILFLSGQSLVQPVLLSLPLSMPAVLFPLALRLGAVGIAIGLICEITLLFSVWVPLLPSLAPPIIIIAAISVIVLGTAWTYREITKGRRAYRAQPMTPLRWRSEF